MGPQHRCVVAAAWQGGSNTASTPTEAVIMNSRTSN